MRRAGTLCVAAALLWAGCQDNLGRTVVGLTSFRVRLVSPAPAERGDKDHPINAGQAIIDVDAVDALGQPYTEDLDVDVYTAFAGKKIGKLTDCGYGEDKLPITTFRMRGGQARAVPVKLDRIFGPATIYIEEHPAEGESPRAVGASEEMFFEYPRIPDVQTPLDLAGETAMYCSAWNGKQVTIVNPTNDGKLVVTWVAPSFYILADTGAMYDPVKKTGGFNHLFVFTFGKPPYWVEPGRLIGHVNGNLSKFVGFTELNFPQQEPASDMDLVTVPDPYPLTDKDIGDPKHILRIASSTVVATARMCFIDTSLDDWKKYNQFQIEILKGFCSSFNGVSVALPSKALGDFDPLKANSVDPAKRPTVTVRGVLRHSSGQNDTDVRTACNTAADCADVGGSACLDTNGQGKTCKKGPYNFFSINPVSPDDIQVHCKANEECERMGLGKCDSGFCARKGQ